MAKYGKKAFERANENKEGTLTSDSEKKDIRKQVGLPVAREDGGNVPKKAAKNGRNTF